jgi:hypothetical protein
MSDEIFKMSTNDFKTKFARFLQKKVFLFNCKKSEL